MHQPILAKGCVSRTRPYGARARHSAPSRMIVTPAALGGDADAGPADGRRFTVQIFSPAARGSVATPPPLTRPSARRSHDTCPCALQARGAMSRLSAARLKHHVTWCADCRRSTPPGAAMARGARSCTPSRRRAHRWTPSPRSSRPSDRHTTPSLQPPQSSWPLCQRHAATAQSPWRPSGARTRLCTAFQMRSAMPQGATS